MNGTYAALRVSSLSKGLYHFSVPEDVVLGTAIGRVKANDQDIGENAQSSYDIIDGDGTALFEITSDAQAQDGIIRLRKVSSGRFCSSSKY